MTIGMVRGYSRIAIPSVIFLVGLVILPKSAADEGIRKAELRAYREAFRVDKTRQSTKREG